MSTAARAELVRQLRGLTPRSEAPTGFSVVADATGAVRALEDLAQLGSGHFRCCDLVVEAGAREDLILAVASPLWSERWAVRVLYPLGYADEERLRRMAAEDARTITAAWRNPVNHLAGVIDNLYFEATRPWTIETLAGADGQPLALLAVLPFTIEFFE